MTRAPGVTELQAKMLRLVRDNGGSLAYLDMDSLQKKLVRSCLYHRWLAPRETLGKSYVIITGGGLAALAYYDASCKQEALWKGARG